MSTIIRAYCDWITRFVRFHHLSSREALLVEAERKVEDFLPHLAAQGKVAASTQKQTLNGLSTVFGIRDMTRIHREDCWPPFDGESYLLEVCQESV